MKRVLVVLVVAAACGKKPIERPKSVGEVAAVTGQVTVDAPSASTETVAVGLAVQRNMTFHTGEASTLEIHFANHYVWKLGPNQTRAIAKLRVVDLPTAEANVATIEDKLADDAPDRTAAAGRLAEPSAAETGATAGAPAAATIEKKDEKSAEPPVVQPPPPPPPPQTTQSTRQHHAEVTDQNLKPDAEDLNLGAGGGGVPGGGGSGNVGLGSIGGNDDGVGKGAPAGGPRLPPRAPGPPAALAPFHDALAKCVTAPTTMWVTVAADAGVTVTAAPQPIIDCVVPILRKAKLAAGTFSLTLP